MNLITDFDEWKSKIEETFPYSPLEFSILEKVKERFPFYGVNLSRYKVEYFDSKNEFYAWLEKRDNIVPLFMFKEIRKFPSIAFFYLIKE